MTTSAEQGLARFVDSMNEWELRYKYERILRDTDRVVYIERHLEDIHNPYEVKKWIDLMLLEAKEYGAIPSLYTSDYGDGLYAEWTDHVLITEEEKQEAREWLAANQIKDSKPIKWRKSVPFNADPLAF